MTIPKLPIGFRVAGVHCGLRSNPNRPDLALVVSDRPAAGVGVYTQNLVAAAPVELDRQRTPSDAIRAIVINAANANACTGEQGARDARQMTAWAADACGCEEREMLVLSTGIIGEPLKMDRLRTGISAAAGQLGIDDDSLVRAAQAMMTTDTVHKIRGREVTIDGATVRVTGVAKGAAMIAPNMATMLAVIMTDAALSVADAQAALAEAVEESFNCISVDGHTSTNDSVILLANGAAFGSGSGSPSDTTRLADKSLAEFRATLVEVCEDLAQAIPADGEGASHLITVEVHGCRSRKEAVRIGKTIADSPLVKTAIAGADPNWGRIVSAAGYAGVAFDPHRVTLHLNGILLYERGTPVAFDARRASESIAAERDTHINLILEEGTAAARFWTTDLTTEYVRLNSEYHT